MLYWADVLPSVASAFMTFGIILSMFFAICSVLFMTAGFGEWTGEYNEKWLNRLRLTPHFFVISIIAVVFSCLIPAKDTFYLIAASEAGEQALATPEMTKVRAVINKWLDDAVKTEEAE